MSEDNKATVLTVTEYVKSANLKGNAEIIGDDEFLWDLGGVILHFLVDSSETTVFYSHRKNPVLQLGHFHEDTCDVINLIQDINREGKRVHIAVLFGGSNFCIEHKTEQKKKSRLLVRHYYSEA